MKTIEDKARDYAHDRLKPGYALDAISALSARYNAFLAGAQEALSSQ